MLDLSKKEEREANENLAAVSNNNVPPTNNEVPQTDVCPASSSAEEFSPFQMPAGDEEDVDQVLSDEDSFSDELMAALRVFGLVWLPCLGHLTQLPIEVAFGEKDLQKRLVCFISSKIIVSIFNI